MARKLKSDRVLFTATFLLVCVSVVMVFSASALVALERFDQPDLFLIKQALWAVLGLAVLAIVMRIDYRTYRSDVVIIGLLAFVGLLLVAVLFSPPVNGSRRWFGLGGLGVQPSELAKVACVLFTAGMLERRMHRINEVSYSLLGIVLVCGLVAGLILFQPDLGTALSLAFIVGVMVFSAGLSYTYVTVGSVIVFPSVLFLIWVEPYRWERVMSFLDPWADPLGHGFQLIQSMIAVGAGGVFGKGLMAGVQKLFYVPEPHTDFIYAVIGEELGPRRNAGRAALLRRHRVAGASHRGQGAGSLRRVPRGRADHDDRRAGVHQHERRAGAAADQGASAAAHQQRWLVAAREPARAWGFCSTSLNTRPWTDDRVDRRRRHGRAPLPRHRRGEGADQRGRRTCRWRLSAPPPASNPPWSRVSASRWT